MRKHFFLISVIAALAVVGCQNESETNTPIIVSENNLPIIQADDEHWQVERNDGTVPKEYEINTGNGFVLDTSGYEIQIPSGLNFTQPNMIQIVLDQDVYYMDWEDGKISYTFTADTVKPLQSSKPFNGLVSGQKIIIAIGFLEDNGQDVFYPLWYAIVNVNDLSFTPEQLPATFEKAAYREVEHVDPGCYLGDDSKTEYPLLSKDPVTLGMCVAGYPNIDGIKPSSVQSFYLQQDKVVVVSTLDGKWMPGDSVRSIEWRVDLVLEGETWAVEWAGVRFKCLANRGHQNWGPELCS